MPWCCKLKFGLIFNEVEAINGKPYFVGKDVAEILEYADPQKSIKMHVDEEDKLTRQITGSAYSDRIFCTVLTDEVNLTSTAFGVSRSSTLTNLVSNEIVV